MKHAFICDAVRSPQLAPAAIEEVFMSGTGINMTAIRQLEQNGGRPGLATMGVGMGQDIALAFEG